MQIITPELFEMTYIDLCNYYLAKYGNAKYDYFSTPECKSVQKKNSRTKEGLEIHHIDENKYPLLSASWAKKMPFECQKAERLVYVNVLEHLLLHIKIYEEQCSEKATTNKMAILGHPGVFSLSNRINDYYAKDCQLNGWHGDMANVIRDNYEDYKKALIYHFNEFSFFHKNKRNMLYDEIQRISKKTDNTVDEKLYNFYTNKYYGLLPYEVGDKVEHIKFGSGIVSDIKEIEREKVVFVKFEQYGQKMILESFEHMHRIKK
jgi:hypothetical protein